MKSVVPDTNMSKSCYDEVVSWGESGFELRYIRSSNYVFVCFVLGIFEIFLDFNTCIII